MCWSRRCAEQSISKCRSLIHYSRYSENTIAILGDDGGPRRRNKRIRLAKTLYYTYEGCNIWQKRKERPRLGGVSLLGIGTVLRLERDVWSMVKRLRQATNEYAPPPPNNIRPTHKQ